MQICEPAQNEKKKVPLAQFSSCVSRSALKMAQLWFQYGLGGHNTQQYHKYV